MKPYFEYLNFEKLDIIQEKVKKVLTDRYEDLFEGGAKVIHPDEEVIAGLLSIDELMDEFESRGWLRHILCYRFFVIEPQSDNGITWNGGGWPIHNDGASFRGFLNDLRVVIPIYNTEGTKTRFYETDHPGHYIDEGGEGKTLYRTWNPEDCTEVTHYELSKGPIVINTDIPHSVDGAINNKHRISMAVNFTRKIKLL